MGLLHRLEQMQSLPNLSLLNRKSLINKAQCARMLYLFYRRTKNARSNEYLEAAYQLFTLLYLETKKSRIGKIRNQGKESEVEESGIRTLAMLHRAKHKIGAEASRFERKLYANEAAYLRLVVRTQDTSAKFLVKLFECECLLHRPKKRLYSLLSLLRLKNLYDKEEVIGLMVKYKRELECLLVYGRVPECEG